MLAMWENVSWNWYRYRTRDQASHESGASIDIELGVTLTSSLLVDSGLSLGVSKKGTMLTADQLFEVAHPIKLTFNLGDEIFTKPLDYKTFSRWDAIEGLMVDMKNDGIIIEELWDRKEKTRIWSGDWNARVRPGLDVHVHCQQAHGFLDQGASEGDGDSEYPDDEAKQRCTNIELGKDQDEWCFHRWRGRVERAKSKHKQMQEPSWLMLALGCSSMLFFFIAVIVYTA